MSFKCSPESIYVVAIIKKPFAKFLKVGILGSVRLKKILASVIICVTDSVISKLN